MATNPLVNGLGGNALANQWRRWDQIPNPNFTTGSGGDNGEGYQTDTPWMDMFDFGRLGFSSAFPPQQDYGDSSPAGDGGMAARLELQAWLDANGYSMGTIPTQNGGHIQALLNQDGSEVDGTRWEKSAPNDNAFWNAALLAGAGIGGGLATGTLGGAGGAVASGAGGGVGTLGTIAPGSAALAPIGATGAGTVGTNAIMGGLGELATVGGGLGGAAGAAGGAGGASGGLSGAWNGTNFGAAGGNSLGSSLSSMGNSLMSPSGLANLASTGLGLYGQNKAIGAMRDATNQSNDLQRSMFDTIRADNQPLVDMRNGVLPQIQALLKNPGSITSDPGYQFQFGEGQKALNNGAAGRGMTYSGAQGKALQRYGQDFASTKLDQSLNRLTNVAGLGQVGSNSNNNAATNYGQTVGNNILNQGNANGSMYAGGEGLVNNALLNVFDQDQYSRLNRRGP